MKYHFDELTIEALEESKTEVDYIYKEIFKDKCYLKHGIKIQEGDVILDVGANLGFFSLFIHQNFKAVKIYAFEPVPPTFEFLKKNTAGLNQITLINKGVYSEGRKLEITYFATFPGNSTVDLEAKQQEGLDFANDFNVTYLWDAGRYLRYFVLTAFSPIRRLIDRAYFKKHFAGTSKFVCEMITLDSVFIDKKLETIDLLKIDIEGAEVAALSGISDQNLSRVRQLVMEVAPANKIHLPALKDRLTKCDFRRIALESPGPTPGSDPETDVYPCVLYAVK